MTPIILQLPKTTYTVRQPKIIQMNHPLFVRLTPEEDVHPLIELQVMVDMEDGVVIKTDPPTTAPTATRIVPTSSANTIAMAWITTTLPRAFYDEVAPMPSITRHQPRYRLLKTNGVQR